VGGRRIPLKEESGKEREGRETKRRSDRPKMIMGLNPKLPQLVLRRCVRS
jgi:hypothetical protein